MSLHLVLCTRGSVLAVLPFLFHCFLPLGHPTGTRGGPLYSFRANICPEGCCKGWFHSTQPCLAPSGPGGPLAWKQLFLEISTVSVTSHVLCNTSHCEVWSSLGHLGYIYIYVCAGIKSFYWRRKSDKIKSLVHIFDGCSQFFCQAAEWDAGAFGCPLTRSDVGLIAPSCPGLQRPRVVLCFHFISFETGDRKSS